MELRILGPLEVVDGDRPVPIRGPKQRALLAILAVAPDRVVPVGVLIEHLWRSTPPAGALNTLQTHIAHLRNALEPERAPGTPPRVLVTAPPGYLLALDDDAVDAHVFERLVQAGRDAAEAGKLESAVEMFDRALELWRGPMLGELASEPFAVAEVVRLEELRLGTIEDRFDAELALGRHVALCGTLDAAANEQPLRERRWKQLMLAFYRSGRQADALRAYQRARKMLGDELGIEPGPALQRLENAIILQEPELDWEPPAPRPLVAEVPLVVGARTATPFVGRSRELDCIARTVDAVSAHGHRLVLVSGEPGIGKSTLAAHAARRAYESGARVLWGRCLEDSLVEYQPFLEAIRPAAAAIPADMLQRALGRGAAELSRLLPELTARLPELVAPLRSDAGTERYLLFEAVTALLAEISRPRPVLLVLDDLHAADQPTLQLMRHIVRHPAGSLAVLATYRHTEVREGHPLVAVAAALHDEGLAERYELGGLPPDEVADLVSTLAGTSAPDEFACAIRVQTEGNPFFIVEMLRHLAESAALVDGNGRWVAEAPVAGDDLPITVADVIARRLARLAPSTVRALTVAAVIGRDFDAELLGAASAIASEHLADALDEAREAGLVVEARGNPPRSAFAHALIRDVLYREIGGLRRTGLHRRVAEALEAAPTSDASPAELAHHFARAGRMSVGRAIAYARRAGEHAMGVLAYEDAVRHYEHALELLRTDGAASDRDRCDVLVELGDASVRAGALAGAREVLAEAAALARCIGDPALLARVALACTGSDRQGLWAEYGLVADDTVALLEEAVAGIDPADEKLHARLLAHLGLELYFSGDERRREDTARRAVTLARRSADAATLGRTLSSCMRAVWSPTNMRERLGYAEEILRLADAADDDELRLAARWRIPTLLEVGRVHEADAAMDVHAALSEAVCHPLDRVWSRGLQGGRAMRRGDFAETERLMTEGMQLAPELFDTIQAFAGQFCTLRWEQGRYEETVALAENFVGQYAHVPAWRAGLAALYAASGQADAAVDGIEAIEAGGLDAVRHDQNWFYCMGALAEAVALVGDGRLAEPVYEVLLPHAAHCIVLGDGFALLCSVSESLGILARAMHQYDAAAEHLRRALATHLEFGAPPLVARTQYEYGRVLLEQADASANAHMLLAHARATASELGMDGVVRAVDALR